MGKFKRLMPYDEALDAMRAHLVPLDTEEAPTISAIGRILAQDVIADSDSPPFDRAAMDGYAVIAADTAAAGAVLSIVDAITAGGIPSRAICRGEAARVMTGAMMPDGADAVLMQEYASETDGAVTAFKAIPPGTHISRKGEDISRGQCVLKRGAMLAPEHVALLVSLGIRNVICYAMPRVAILATGDELATPGTDVSAGHIIDSNSGMLTGLASMCGCAVTLCETVADDRDALRGALARARGAADMVLVTGGSSFGDKDYAQEVIGNLVFHGVAVKPGKPFGFSEGRQPVFMMSGYPVAAFMQMYLFFIPYLEALTGATMLARVLLPLSEQVGTSLGRAVVVRARVHDGMAVPIRRSGSSKLSSLAWADGFVLSSALEEGINAHERHVFTFFLM